MAAQRRLMKELKDIQLKLESNKNKPEESGKKHSDEHEDHDFLDACCIRKVNLVEESNCLNWECCIQPRCAPYEKNSYKVLLVFPAEYPFKPPKLTFATKIYHPNIDEKGQVCLPIISPENWKPATKTDQVLLSLVKMIHEPEPEHPLRADVAEEYSRAKKKFFKNAEEFAAKNGMKKL